MRAPVLLMMLDSQRGAGSGGGGRAQTTVRRATQADINAFAYS